MTTLTQTITQELLDTVDNPSGLEEVFQRYRSSKGPLYGALAQATATLMARLSSLSKEIQAADRQYQGKQEQGSSMDRELAQKERKLGRLTGELNHVNEELEQKKALLNQANSLAAMGFGQEELARLRDILAQVAASQGAPPEEGVSQFFQTVERYEHIVSLDLEAKRAKTTVDRAKAEVRRWEAELKGKEAQAKARMATIDIADSWLSRGVKEQDVPAWDMILRKAQVSPADLAKDLDKYGSLEALCRNRAQLAESLRALNRKAEADLKAVQQQEAGVKAAIVTTRDGALSEMERVSRQACQHLDTLNRKAQDYGELERRAGRLSVEMTLAQALTTNDPQQWIHVPREAIQRVMAGAVLWARHGDRNREVKPPEAICQPTSVQGWNKVKLEHLLLWAYAGTMTEEERRAMAGMA